MIKVNLEKKLLAQNKRLITPEELLLVQEYDRHTEIADDNTLKRVGIHQAITQGREIKNVKDTLKKETERFNQERVFHISQIEAICKKYHLRFLPAPYYKGRIDSELPNRINNFEIATGVKCDTNNSMIVAPASSFKLGKMDKDPLFFYQINKEYYYLVHKWGNDLNMLRRLFPILSSRAFCTLATIFGLTLIVGMLSSIYGTFEGIVLFTCVTFVLTGLLSFMYGLINHNSPGLRFVAPNYWDRPIKD